MARKIKSPKMKALSRRVNGKLFKSASRGAIWFSSKTGAKKEAERQRKFARRAIVVKASFRGKSGYRVLTYQR